MFIMINEKVIWKILVIGWIKRIVIFLEDYVGKVEEWKYLESDKWN